MKVVNKTKKQKQTNFGKALSNALNSIFALLLYFLIPFYMSSVWVLFHFNSVPVCDGGEVLIQDILASSQIIKNTCGKVQSCNENPKLHQSSKMGHNTLTSLMTRGIHEEQFKLMHSLELSRPVDAKELPKAQQHHYWCCCAFAYLIKADYLFRY